MFNKHCLLIFLFVFYKSGTSHLVYYLHAVRYDWDIRRFNVNSKAFDILFIYIVDNAVFIASC